MFHHTSNKKKHHMEWPSFSCHSQGKHIIILPTLLLFASLGMGQTAEGQAADTIRLNTLDTTIQLAYKSNLNQAIYQQQIRQAQFNYKAAKSIFYPNISGGFNGTDNLSLPVTPVPGQIFGSPGKTIYARFGKQYVYDAGLTLNSNILNWASVLQMKIAEKNVALAGLQQDAFKQSLKEQVARLYYSILIAKSALLINRRDRLLADSVLALSRQKLDNGAADLPSVNEAVINSNTIRQNQEQSQQLLDQSTENLKILLGEKPSVELALTDDPDLDTLNFPDLPRLGVDKNIGVYQQQSTLAGLQSRSQKAAAYPTLSATSFLGDQQYRDNLGLSFNNNAWSSYRYVEVTLTVPLFTGFSNKNKYKSSLVQQRISELQLESEAQQSEINDRLLAKNYADYLEMVKASANSFVLYGQNVALNEQKYTEGLVSLDIYMKTFQDYLSAENVYLNNLSQLLSVKSTFLSRQ
jgi:outer membrane protein